MIIPDKKATEVAVKKIFRLMFPNNEKLTSPDIDFSDRSLDDAWLQCSKILQLTGRR